MTKLITCDRKIHDVETELLCRFRAPYRRCSASGGKDGNVHRE